MLGAARAVLFGAAGRAPLAEVQLAGSWPLSETSGTIFADATGTNDATLMRPSWAAIETVEWNRPGIISGEGDHALEVSNHNLDIPMVATYQQDAMSLVLYVEPRGELRGVQYWDTADERFGREFLAFSDDGSTPGSFAIYRRRNGLAGTVGQSGTAEWRLGGYVRDSGGTKQYFGGGLAGVAGADLPVDTAKRVVLTQGPAGAELWLDGTKVATLATTEGWSSLSGNISIGASDDQGHANDRSPLWGRVDEIRVYQGQLAQSDIDALPAAQDALLYRIPTDGPLINIADHAGDIQAAMDEADAVAGYVYQDASDTTWYTVSSTIGHKPIARGVVGLRARRAADQNEKLTRMFEVTDATLGDHGDPFAASGGYKYIGCQFDGNARKQDWAPTSDQASADGTSNSGFDLQFAHCILSESTQKLTITYDACDFFDNTGDGISMSENSAVTAGSCRFFGTFRGPFIFNEFINQLVTAVRYEGHVNGRMAGSYENMGSGLNDLEPFQPAGSDFNDWRCADAWAEGDWDDRNYEINGGTGSSSKYYNAHTTTAPLAFQPDRTGSEERDPTSDVEVQRCTMSYYKKGYKKDGTTSGNFPSSLLRGATPGVSGIGWLMEGCVFIANGRPFNLHEFGIADPADEVSPSTKIEYQNASHPTGRRITMRNCEFRVADLPAGIATSDLRAIDFQSTDTSREIELDGVTIDGAFADLPFDMGGQTVRHRNVTHERTGSTTPWSNAGAEVEL